ncbi:uncharacterized protein LOC124308780 isoform X1 [Neodiprion virginianus]|uniref:uncharacterized protein LOC124308780 isoform X1 n=1 Tax=Neodiprion virginianus TaxID=2961670 RepID=UPI001EE76449|nr:uncharacterized protein LOC124308780 isoform X1 [Neodiprion virginianus]
MLKAIVNKVCVMKELVKHMKNGQEFGEFGLWMLVGYKISDTPLSQHQLAVPSGPHRICNHEDLLPDALENDCKSCNDRQKAGSEKVIRFLVNERPEIWDKLAKKFDPDNRYRVKFQAEAKKAGIAL